MGITSWVLSNASRRRKREGRAETQLRTPPVFTRGYIRNIRSAKADHGERHVPPQWTPIKLYSRCVCVVETTIQVVATNMPIPCSQASCQNNGSRKSNDMRPNQASHRPLNNLGMEMDGRILISFPQIVPLGLPLWRRHIPWANASLEAPGSGYGGDTTGGAFLQSIRSGRDRRPPRILG